VNPLTGDATARTGFAREGSSDGSQSGAISRRTSPRNAPLSFAQQRLWYLDLLGPGNSAYCFSYAIRLGGQLDVEALERSSSEIVRRHEALRTTFELVGNQPVQLVAAAQPVPLPVVDLQAVPEAEREAEALRLANEEARRPFDLARGPLFRARLLRLGTEDHLLVLALHHSVCDSHSLGILLEELGQLYRAFSAGQPSPLAEPAIQYGDYAHWQRAWSRRETLETQLGYWRQQLAGVPVVLALPTDRPRPLVLTPRGARVAMSLPRELTAELKALSQREGVTLFMTLLAAWQTLLARYTGREDIVVGSPVANRTRVETEGLIGSFANILVLRADASGDPSFRDFLARVRETVSGAQAHGDLPFERLVEELQPKRTLSHTPLFQVMLTLEDGPLPLPALPGLQSSRVALTTETVRFDLSLSMTEESGGLAGWLEYSTDLFEAETIARMAGHLQTLLEGIVANPDERLSALPLLTEAERRQLLVEWNDTRVEYPAQQSIHALVEAQAARTPHAVAIEFGGERISYEELNARANQLARYLRGQGVGPEVLVGVFTDRSVEMVVGLLAILKAGGAYVPLDPSYPQRRLKFILEDARPAVVLTQRPLLDRLPETAARLFCLDSEWEFAARHADGDLRKVTTCENLAYVIYTSGSTGAPKGVAIEHRNAITLIYWARDTFSREELAGVLASTSICFDLSVFELFVPLSWGGSVILAENALQLASLPAARRVTLVNSVPSVVNELMGSGGLPANVRAVNLAGEVLRSSLARSIYEQGTVTRVLNLYGPSEDTTYSTFAVVDSSPGETVPIGRPIANTEAYLLDSHLQPVRIGEPGELYLGGQGLARGYLNRPGLTAERFLPNPFAGEAGARMYKTGDLARYGPDGALEFIGRIDHQVKLRGFRIELGEIELALEEHEAVRQCVVVVCEDARGERRLVAYVAAAPQADVASSALRDHLRARLPQHMVPPAFVVMAALPLTPNGKVDRQALPAPEAVSPETERALLAPRDSLERQLAQIWEKVLGVARVGVDENFFELGGHSLLTVRVFAQIEKVLGKSLPPTMLYRAPTVAQLADMLRRDGWKSAWSSLVPIQPEGDKPPFYCIHAGGGHVLFYRDLAHHLGADQPLYGLQARGLDGKQPRHTRIEDMAEHYIKEIRELQPVGPYYLGGSSFGGLVAFEMAQQLRAQGQRVALVALFDTHGPGYPRLRPGQTGLRRSCSRLLQQVQHHAGNLRLLEPGARLAYVQEKKEKARRQMRRGIARRRKAISRRIYDAMGRPLPRALRQTQGAIAQAHREYEPARYPEKLTLFRASVQPAGIYPDPTLGWGPLAQGGLEIHEVPGYHGAIVVEPRVRLMVGQLQECLAKARAASEVREPAARVRARG
jgi:amino acid adenylation domain-containing protein